MYQLFMIKKNHEFIGKIFIYFSILKTIDLDYIQNLE